MSVPIAVTGWIPKMRISSGVISDAPPIPVSPTRRPMANPKSMMIGSIPMPKMWNRGFMSRFRRFLTDLLV